MIIEKSLKIKFIQKCKCGAVTIRFTGETSKMSWAALPVEPACMGKAVGEAGRPLMLCGARLYIITYSYLLDMGEKKIKMCQKKDESIKKVLEEIEDKAIESRYTNMYDWQRRELSKEDLFEYAEEMKKCLDKIFDLTIDERLK